MISGFGIALGYGLVYRAIMVILPTEARDCFLLQTLQTGFEA
jgi:hypothetical protein